MKAADAKLLTHKNLTGGLLKPLREYVDTRIAAAAQKGKSEVNHPFQGFKGGYPSEALQQALWASLRNDGYTVEHHPNPDPGHPCSSAYDSVSW